MAKTKKERRVRITTCILSAGAVGLVGFAYGTAKGFFSGFNHGYFNGSGDALAWKNAKDENKTKLLNHEYFEEIEKPIVKWLNDMSL